MGSGHGDPGSEVRSGRELRRERKVLIVFFLFSCVSVYKCVGERKVDECECLSYNIGVSQQ